MLGTGSVNIPAPVNVGTSVVACAQTNGCVVAGQRSGSPKRSTSRSRVAAS